MFDLAYNHLFKYHKNCVSLDFLSIIPMFYAASHTEVTYRYLYKLAINFVPIAELSV